MSPPFRSVALLGLGLIGGSLAHALRRRHGGAVRITAWTPDGSEPRIAASRALIDEAAGSPRKAVEAADLVVLAAPVGACIELLSQIVADVPSDALVSDVASVKAPLHEAARLAGLEHRFIGAHPLCGSETSGLAAAQPTLFEDARVFVTATLPQEPSASALPRIERFWTELGARTERIEPVVHDRLMAWISHLPQILASTLAAALAEAGIGADQLGPGGRSMTRLAGSSPALWSDLLEHNRDAVAAALGPFAERLGRSLEDLGGNVGDPFGASLREGFAWARRTP